MALPNVCSKGASLASFAPRPACVSRHLKFHESNSSHCQKTLCSVGNQPIVTRPARRKRATQANGSALTCKFIHNVTRLFRSSCNGRPLSRQEQSLQRHRQLSQMLYLPNTQRRLLNRPSLLFSPMPVLCLLLGSFCSRWLPL